MLNVRGKSLTGTITGEKVNLCQRRNMWQPPWGIAEGQDAPPKEDWEVEGMDISQNDVEERREPSPGFGCNSGFRSRAEMLLLF